MSDAGPAPKMSIGTKSEDTGEKRKELWGTATVPYGKQPCCACLSYPLHGVVTIYGRAWVAGT